MFDFHMEVSENRDIAVWQWVAYKKGPQGYDFCSGYGVFRSPKVYDSNMILFIFSQEKGVGLRSSPLPHISTRRDCRSTSSPRHRSPFQDTAGSLKDSRVSRSPY